MIPEHCVEELTKFFNNEQLTSKHWLVRKAIAVVSIVGSLTRKETQGIEMKDVEYDSENGFKITVYRHIRNAKVPYTFHIPHDNTYGNVDACSIVEEYYHSLVNDQEQDREGQFFMAPKGKSGRRYTKIPLGVNAIGRVARFYNMFKAQNLVIRCRKHRQRNRRNFGPRRLEQIHGKLLQKHLDRRSS